MAELIDSIYTASIDREFVDSLRQYRLPNRDDELQRQAWVQEGILKGEKKAQRKIAKAKREAEAKAAKARREAEAKAAKARREAEAKAAKAKREAEAKVAKARREAVAKAKREALTAREEVAKAFLASGMAQDFVAQNTGLSSKIIANLAKEIVSSSD